MVGTARLRGAKGGLPALDPRASAVYTKSNIQIIGNGLVVAQRG
jgi:hypothetical protein